VALLALNGLRISEALAADVSDLGQERGHRTLTVDRKGGKRQTIALAPRTACALDSMLAGRTDGPLFITRTATGIPSTARQRTPSAHTCRVRRAEHVRLRLA
jgi:integrase/recombinase XerD